MNSETLFRIGRVIDEIRPSVKIYDGNEQIAYYETDKEFVKDFKRLKQIENNWNELKKWLEGMLDNEHDIFSVVRAKDVLNKMQELEHGKDE